MEQQDNNLEPIEDAGILSRRNQKRFNKLLPQLDQKFKELEIENQSLKDKASLLASELEATKTPEVIENKIIISDYDKAHKEYLKAQTNSEETEKHLAPHSSSVSDYGSEIIWFSVIIKSFPTTFITFIHFNDMLTHFRIKSIFINPN